MARPAGFPRIVYADAFRRLCVARDLVREKSDEPLTVEQLARAAGMSRFHFLRLFRDVMGVTPHQYLMRVRLERACEQLARGRSVTEACFGVGFSSLGSFSSLFRREHGCSPQHYARRVRALVSVPADVGRIHVPHCFYHHFAGSAAARPEAQLSRSA